MQQQFNTQLEQSIDLECDEVIEFKSLLQFNLEIPQSHAHQPSFYTDSHKTLLHLIKPKQELTREQKHTVEKGFSGISR